MDSTEKNITVKNIDTNEVFKDTYDKLVLATGAVPFSTGFIGFEMIENLLEDGLKEMQ